MMVLTNGAGAKEATSTIAAASNVTIQIARLAGITKDASVTATNLCTLDTVSTLPVGGLATRTNPQ
jgi:hypothetical protein